MALADTLIGNVQPQSVGGQEDQEDGPEEGFQEEEDEGLQVSSSVLRRRELLLRRLQRWQDRSSWKEVIPDTQHVCTQVTNCPSLLYRDACQIAVKDS